MYVIEPNILTVSLAILELELTEAEVDVDWHIELLPLLLESDSPSRSAQAGSPATGLLLRAHLKKNHQI